jgi:hypothetical protein
MTVKNWALSVENEKINFEQSCLLACMRCVGEDGAISS